MFHLRKVDLCSAQGKVLQLCVSCRGAQGQEVNEKLTFLFLIEVKQHLGTVLQYMFQVVLLYYMNHT